MTLNNTEPTSLAELVLKPDTRQTLEMIVNRQKPFATNDVTGLVLYGPPGTGKTTTAKLLPQLLDPCLSQLPEPELVGGWFGMLKRKGIMQREWFCGAGCGGRNNGISLINDIENYFANGLRGESGFAYVILNEADMMTADARQSLRALMDRFQNVVYILTTNHLNEIEAGVRDRSHLLDMGAASTNEWAERCNQILRANGMKPLNSQQLAPLFAGASGSARKIVTALETAVNLSIRLPLPQPVQAAGAQATP